MVVDRLAQAVRQQLGLGRLLPLGGPGDGAWLTERAAHGVLRRAAEAVPGVRLETLRVNLADPAAAEPPAVPPPPSALPAGPLRIDAEFAASADHPLPVAADRLRGALFGAARDRLGLLVRTVDLRVTGLLDGPGAPRPAGRARSAQRPPAADDSDQVPAGAVAARAMAAAVPGVARLTPVLGGSGQAVRVEDRSDRSPGRHVLVQVAVTADRRALDVALAVRAAVASAVSGPVTVAVLVTWVETSDG
ncbi:hypothetical protein RKE29_29270 [Streptomyces sp. B1866]|uniref:hypothetical protein n=1 Tax=Streptomyces sp. B1866 TaxID=3075431 RepID=UPI00288DD6FC|nr:hypothetical protein [Streptomyces sp. B1866]MDT3400645.1 hypothetical protein [Streptomyces sp. B1866]